MDVYRLAAEARLLMGARLVAVGVWGLIAKGKGKTSADVQRIIAAIFPGDEIDVDQVRCWLRQVVDAGICKLEKQDGQWWLLKGDGSFAINGLPKKRGKAAEVIGSPVVKVFPCRGKIKEWSLTRADVDGWQAEFPGLDVMHCATCAYVYVMADVARQKTAKGMRRFLADWIMREANAQKRAPQGARAFDAKASRFEPSKAFAEFGATVN